MRRISTFFYGIGQGFAGLARNRMFSLASIATMAACLFLFGIFYIVLSNFNHMVHEAEGNVGLTVFFDDGISYTEIESIGDKLRKRAEVSEVIFTSGDEAWEKYKSEKLSPEMIETFGDDNPLKDSSSFTVYMSDPEMQKDLVAYASGLEGVRKINDTTDISEGLTGINTVLATVSIIIIVVLLLVAIFLISITISTGVSVRKQEISIMKLIGATDIFIRIPFIVEGMLIGLFGAGIPSAVFFFFYDKMTGLLTDKFSSVFSLVSFLERGEVMKILIPVTAGIGLGIGLIGSNMTLRRQLKKIAVKE
ncbi:MAG: permease-like cell division protein FtsX [Lachnospiraceae bacterium]|jgi:cell division transport system permease protein|nr:permease-like cell division protein FtsX [Lachnospiraceae bacterium]